MVDVGAINEGQGRAHHPLACQGKKKKSKSGKKKKGAGGKKKKGKGGKVKPLPGAKLCGAMSMEEMLQTLVENDMVRHPDSTVTLDQFVGDYNYLGECLSTMRAGNGQRRQ